MKRSFELNKLVRTGKFVDMRAQKQEVRYRQLEGKELHAALGSKLVEEATEFDPDSSDPLKELADLQQAIKDTAEARGYTLEDVEQRRQEEEARWGGFERGIFVETVTLDESSRWAAYYASDPERFPEIVIDPSIEE